MRADANQIAFDVVRSILDAARPLELQVAGKAVSVVVSRDVPSPWPDEGLTAVRPETSMPPPVRAECTWLGGSATLVADLFPAQSGRYAGSVRLRVAHAGRWLLISNVHMALADVNDGELAAVIAWARLAKQGTAAADQPELNRALNALASSAGFTMLGRSKVELARVRVPDGAIADGAEAAFRRLLLLALLKLDFVARGTALDRGAPLIDLGKLGLSPAAIASLAEPEVRDEEESDDDDDAAGANDVMTRVRRRVERAVPDIEDRRGALELLAHAVENANDERPTGWYLQDRSNGLSLFAGRLWVCALRRGMVYLSVVGPISPEIYSALGAAEDENTHWKAIAGGVTLRFSASKALVALQILKEPFDRFVDEAMARMRRRLDPASHVRETIDYLAEAVGRALPQPELTTDDSVESADEDSDTEESPTSREPLRRGRGAIFDKGHRSIISLVTEVEQRRIALPDLQRPFVWEDTKVRDLLDSLFLGYPAGTVVLWQTDDVRDARTLGSDRKVDRASALVIDGQQRLTSLYAVIKGAEVVDKDGEKRRIRIAFRPRDGRFEVPDAAIRQDPEWLADVSELWCGKRNKREIRKEMLAALAAKGREISDSYEDAVEHNLERLRAIDEFEFPVVEIRKGDADDEAVADIFVRINNQGTRLGQADFVLTLLSVYHGVLRDKIEESAVSLSQNAVVAVDAQQVLRAACAVGFERARMSAIYKFLRGVDPNSGETSPADRKARLDRLDAATVACLDPTTWRDYLLRVHHAGFVTSALVASPNAVINAFAFYVKGRYAGLEKHRLDRLISRWLFATLLTARYSSSSETAFEADLNRVRGLGPNDGHRFAQTLDDVLSATITGDYWSRTLVDQLRTQRNRAPSALAFRAAQIVLGARALFSDQSLHAFLQPGPRASRSATEQHHLFPKAWLVKKGVTDRRDVNQVANLADVGWSENGEIGASGPSSYVPRLRDKLGLDDARWGRMCAEHGLPPSWEVLSYDDFLNARRQRMAEIVRAAFRKLGGEEEAAPIAPPWFLPGADVVWTRIVETERALRSIVREVYGKRFAAQAAQRIETALPAPELESLHRALRSRPAGSDPMSVVDYLYLKQLPTLLFSNDVWADAKARLGSASDVKRRLSEAVDDIAPVRNEIAHVREVAPERLQKATVACNDILALTGRS